VTGRMRITVIGAAGYLGSTHAAGMAELGFDVVGLDVNADRIALLQQGRSPLFEPGLEEVLTRHTGSGRLRFTTDVAEAAAFGEVHFLCVGTPQRDRDGAADLRQVQTAWSSLVPHLRGDHTVVLKSTVPVGTTQSLVGDLDELSTAARVQVVFNGEFLREGHAVQDTLLPDRIVIGVSSDPAAAAAAEKVMRSVYAGPIAAGCPFLVTDYATAELVKLAANSFLATKISFINALAELCEATGADVSVLADGIGHDARIGRGHLNAGLGFGGGCLPKDLRAFMARAGEMGVGDAMVLLREVDAINGRQRLRAVEIATGLLGGDVVGRPVAVLGAAFKPHSDDVRDSPALEVASQLDQHGAAVRVYDPKAMANAARLWPRLSYEPSAAAACAGADLVVMATGWPEFAALDPAELATVVRRPVVYDAINLLDPETWRAAGWTYRGTGRP
jgi:UDPglucose 6-dehydrogenase